MKARQRIEQSERGTIMRHLKRWGKWSTSRRGNRIRFWRRPSPDGRNIGYQVFPTKTRSVSGAVHTLQAAIDACNGELEAPGSSEVFPRPTPVPIVAQAAAAPRQAPLYQETSWSRLPYADQ